MLQTRLFGRDHSLKLKGVAELVLTRGRAQGTNTVVMLRTGFAKKPVARGQSCEHLFTACRVP